jgi:hypothetical protein
MRVGFVFEQVVLLRILNNVFKHVQVPLGFGPARELGVIYVDMPSGEAAKTSNSYNLSIFSSGSEPDVPKNGVVVSEGSSPSIGELWPDRKLGDEVNHEDTAAPHAHDATL